MDSKGLSIRELGVAEFRRFFKNIEVTPNNGCWKWHGTMRNKAGYGQMFVRGRYLGAHIFSYVVFIGDVPPGQCVLHKCDTPSCQNPKHFFIGTKADNNTDRSRKGRTTHHIGETNGRAILKESQVLQIRSLAKTEPYDELAKRFGVKTVTIAKIAQRKLWRHIK